MVERRLVKGVHMKKSVKWALIAVIVVGIIAGSVFYMSMPAAVETVVMRLATAELYFLEQGVVSKLREISVFAALPGEITEIFVSEGQEIRAGDPICKLNDMELVYQIRQIEAAIRGHEAQLAGLAGEERIRRDSLASNRARLLEEVAALDAQERGANISLDEQLRLQSIVIQQAQEELERARENAARSERLREISAARLQTELQRVEADLETARILYEIGDLPRQSYDTAANAVRDARIAAELNDEQMNIERIAAADAVTALEAALEIHRQQYNVIESGDGTFHFYTLRNSLLAQAQRISDSIAADHTADTARYLAALIEGSRASIRLLEMRIEDTLITSPVDGIITELFIKDTNIVNTMMPIALITAPVICVVEVYVSVRDMNAVFIGKEVAMTLDSRFGQARFDGIVTAIENRAEIRVSSLGIEERKVRVSVTPLTYEGLKDGYTLDVRFDYFHAENVLVVPKTAVFRDGGEDNVWLIRDGSAQTARIVKGMELRTGFVVEQGLEQGDIVIINANLDVLREGARVR